MEDLFNLRSCFHVPIFLFISIMSLILFGSDHMLSDKVYLFLLKYYLKPIKTVEFIFPLVYNYFNIKYTQKFIIIY